jgi:hypothetical protein
MTKTPRGSHWSAASCALRSAIPTKIGRSAGQTDIPLVDLGDYPSNPLDVSLAQNRTMSSTKTSSTGSTVNFKTRAGGFLPRWRGLRGRRSNGRPLRRRKTGAVRRPARATHAVFHCQLHPAYVLGRDIFPQNPFDLSGRHHCFVKRCETLAWRELLANAANFDDEQGFFAGVGETAYRLSPSLGSLVVPLSRGGVVAV